MDVLDFMNADGGVMPERSARAYFKQLLDGIACIHAHGFCHRDIKPENAIIEQDTGVLKIIDFGLSKHLDSARTLGIGTPDYMAPEILGRTQNPGGGLVSENENETGSYDPESVDVWAMGVMLYLLLTGTYPFEDRTRPGNVTATLRRVREGRVNPFPKNVRETARDLVGRMIQVDPRRRARLEDVANHPWLREEVDFVDFEMTDARMRASAGDAPAGPGGDAGTATTSGAHPGARETPRGFARRVSGFFSGMFGGAGKREG
jgi:serine/threonine protein kinase